MKRQALDALFSQARQHTMTQLLAGASAPVRRALVLALEGRALSCEEGELLMSCPDADLPALIAVADQVRRDRVGDAVSFVITRNINFTNVCYMGCRFCGFARRREQQDAYWLSLEEIASRAQVAWDRGATEVCMQGGLHPDLPASYYENAVRAARQQVPGMHVHAFSPFEIWFGAHKQRAPEAVFLARLKEAGLGSIPGTAAEILDVEIRQALTRNKLSADRWVSIIKAAHGVGLKSTATMMYGHIDRPVHWARHMALLRDIQKETGGFTEFVPLGFVHAEAPLYVERKVPGVRRGASVGEHVRVHATARLMLAGWIDNIQVSWVKLGPALSRLLLDAGVNDLGGTLMEENISRSAGAAFGEELTPLEMVELIRLAGRPARRRSTLYQWLEQYDDHDPVDWGPLKPRPWHRLTLLQADQVAEPEVAHV